MIDAKLVALSFVVLLAGAIMYVNTQKERRSDVPNLEYTAGADYDAPYPHQVQYFCNEIINIPGRRESTMPCLVSFCDALDARSVTVDTKFQHVCADGSERSLSFTAVASSEDWLELGLGDSQVSANAGDKACAAFPAASGGATLSGNCGSAVPYMAATLAAEHWRTVNKANMRKFGGVMEAVCADPAFADGCPEAFNGFKSDRTTYFVECPDDLGSFEFNFRGLLTELDAIVMADGGEAEVKALLYGKCSTDRRLSEGSVAFTAAFKAGDYGPVSVEEDNNEVAPHNPSLDNAQCFVDAGCKKLTGGCDDDKYVTCVAASGCEGAAAMCLPDDDDENDNRRLAVDADTMFDFLDEDVADEKPRSLGALLKKEHGAAKAKSILELRASLHERKLETGADSRELGWAHYGGRRRRWGAYWHHHHNPHHHNPHAHTPADCLGCTVRDGNVCFGRCGPGCDKWNACGNDGNNAHKACWWHDSYCGRSMTNIECAQLMTDGIYTKIHGVAAGICEATNNQEGSCNGGSCSQPDWSGCLLGVCASGANVPPRSVHEWGRDSEHALGPCDVCNRMNWGASNSYRSNGNTHCTGGHSWWDRTFDTHLEDNCAWIEN